MFSDWFVCQQGNTNRTNIITNGKRVKLGPKENPLEFGIGSRVG